MCGIGGILRITKPGERHEPIPEAWLDALDAEIAWRGPDGHGRFRDTVTRPDGSVVQVALVHRRLSIIDHAGGGQPFALPLRGAPEAVCGVCSAHAGTDEHSSEPDRLSVVFNGCIYNHRKLRADLIAKGHHFVSDHSDTEVLLHGWREWGPFVTKNLDGMYAFALWDRRFGWLFIARDRFGEKPLYWQHSSDRRVWAFASSVAAMVTVREAIAPNVERVHKETLKLWIPGGVCVGSLTVDGAAEQLEVGECVVMPRHPWPEDSPEPLPRVSWAPHALPLSPDNVGPLGELLGRAIASRLEADVPVGCFLSGGIDSSLVTLIAHRHRPDLPAFTVRMPNATMDESHWAQGIARQIGCRHEVIECDPSSAADDFRRLIRLLGQPFGDASLLPTYWLCRAARRVVKVALSGDGGDEIFCGYRRYRAVKPLRSWGWLLKLFPERVLDRSNSRSGQETLARMIDAARGEGFPELGTIFSHSDRRHLCGESVTLAMPWSSRSDADWARKVDAVRYLPDDLLRKVDTASMAAGLEVRCPFLEPELVAAAFSTPATVHLANDETKHLLRHLARRHFPRELIDRPKQGFAIPIADWWRSDFGGLGTLLFDYLDKPRPFGQVHDVLPINMDYVRQMIDEHWAAGGLTPKYTTRHVRKRDHGQRLFSLVSLAIWAESLADRRPARDA